MERDVEHVHHELDKAARHIRGTESVTGAVKNAFTSAPKGAHKDMQYVDRTVQVKEKVVVEQIEILHKLPNDDLVPAVLHLSPEGFCIIDTPDPATTPAAAAAAPPPGGGAAAAAAAPAPAPAAAATPTTKPIPYDWVHQIVIRARPQHIDIRLAAGKGDRQRMLTSYMQWVVCEFTARNSSVLVVFEPNAPSFEFKDQRIRHQSTTNRKTLVGRNGELIRAGHQLEDPLLKHAPASLRQDLKQQDQDLDQIHTVLGDLHGMATAMGGVIDDQIRQVDRVTTRAQEATERIKKQTTQVENI
eukprot:TRINITY_DN1459_c0_g2_i2.p1 TRINITY_DN1459_c0_g2~~TRINITY_DN1459_c0_g2_i2.p1  ORF type:complete len:301 (-),score=96.30 TRINITY_DN1459_c0_g2_i2:126-1028(-)